MINFNYKPDGKTLKDFMKDNNFFRGIRGPVGSGKSVGCCVEVFRRALEQKPNKDKQIKMGCNKKHKPTTPNNNYKDLA